ncbi:hypothetical protein KM043_010963 [Ampulex compressa]|nr:hypothetical protein KM043_010963 [Ampulex compressa]
MDEKCKEMDGVRSGAEERVRILGAEVAERETWANGVERELRVEREWRTSLQESSICNTEKISQLHQEIDQLKRVSEKYLALQEEHYALKEICTEQERTLEELGGQLSAAKLAAVELREAADNAQQQHQQQDGAPAWANDRLVTQCTSCNREFNITRRKHHCRNCGKIFCSACSDNSTALPNSPKPVRVCDECYAFLLGRYSVAGHVSNGAHQARFLGAPLLRVYTHDQRVGRLYAHTKELSASCYTCARAARQPTAIGGAVTMAWRALPCRGTPCQDHEAKAFVVEGPTRENIGAPAITTCASIDSYALSDAILVRMNFPS